MIASVQIADVRVRTALATLRKAPPTGTPGLRWAMVALAAPLRSQVLPAPPSLKRIALLSFWDDDAALDRWFAADAPAAFHGGWSSRLEPLRAFGSWPGLDAEVPAARRVDYDGPAVVFTLGRLRLSQGLRFLRTSAPAEAAVLAAPGCIWATGLGRPPYVATCSLWEGYDAINKYAFADKSAAHPRAIAADARKGFHHQEAFIRFRPYAATGALTGKNALSEHSLATN
ncbi:MAG TPA: spheroidene monooxygenase [Acidimicrobiia bacterium]|nr:spheroidene monooxygenase [Acidimicrobiia bacterium]